MVDKIYAMSSFLQYRTVCDPQVSFTTAMDAPRKKNVSFRGSRTPIHMSDELLLFIENYILKSMENRKVALALSGGIDSAICAKYMPKGSVAYTFKCVVPGKNVTDESIRAKEICRINNLEHRIVEIYWEDFESLSPILMKHKRAPFHSIEVQIYKAALQARKDGFEGLLFAEGADVVFGGLSGLLSRDYALGEFVERYSFVMPYKVLKDFTIITELVENYCDGGFIDAHGFIEQQFFLEYINSYDNACDAACMEFLSPFMHMVHQPLDMRRIRRGEAKYLMREAFTTLYPHLPLTEKTPMPRPMDEWFANWEGPKRPEFWENCHVNMTGDQKYYIWALERFLNLLDEMEAGE